jgi:hypothetical protein
MLAMLSESGYGYYVTVTSWGSSDGNQGEILSSDVDDCMNHHIAVQASQQMGFHGN